MWERNEAECAKSEGSGPRTARRRAGAFLYVKQSGALSWVLRYPVQGRRHDLGLGAFPDVTLAMARDRAIDARRLITEGEDPIAKKQQAKPKTFKEAALDLIESKKPALKNAKHAAQWSSTLDTYVFPKAGRMQVTMIQTADVVAVLTRIWSEKPETANRVRQRIAAVIDDARALGIRKGENPAYSRSWVRSTSSSTCQLNSLRFLPNRFAQGGCVLRQCRWRQCR